MNELAGRLNERAVPGRKSSLLAEHLLERLNGYAIGAGAAGVALLACTTSAEAAPVCEKLSVGLNYTDTYALNPANQKIAPFDVAHTFNEISSLTHALQVRGFFTPNTPGAQVIVDASGLPAELASGAGIGPGGNFGKGKGYGLLFGYYYQNRFKGNFQPNQSGYVGFQFSESGEPHYGWLRVQLANQAGESYPSLFLSEFGYESAPNTAILAGSCASSESSAAPTSNPQLQPAREVKKSDKPTSVGLLALGHSGLPVWREKR